MDDETARLWAMYDVLSRRQLALEAIADRLAATCPDPVAVEDFFDWKVGRDR